MKYDHRMMGNSLQVKKKRKRKQTIGPFMPPLDAPGAPLGGTPPSLRITDLGYVALPDKLLEGGAGGVHHCLEASDQSLYLCEGRG